MKVVALEQSTLAGCVDDARADRVVVLRGGHPVALVVGVDGLDQEQVELGSDPAFWSMNSERRNQATIDRGELERRLEAAPERGT